MGWSTRCSEKYVLTNDVAGAILADVVTYGLTVTVSCILKFNRLQDMPMDIGGNDIPMWYINRERDLRRGDKFMESAKKHMD